MRIGVARRRTSARRSAWGDGQTSQGWIDGSNGSFTVTGDHVYLHPGSLPLEVTVTDPAGETATATATATITEAPITATGGFVDGAVKGASATFTVGAFSDANPYDAADQYTATITWGDGYATTGTVSGVDGVFVVTGYHSYGADGSYPVGLTITDADGTTATASSTVIVGDIYAGPPATLTVATFSSSDPYASHTASRRRSRGATTTRRMGR